MGHVLDSAFCSGHGQCGFRTTIFSAFTAACGRLIVTSNLLKVNLTIYSTTRKKGPSKWMELIENSFIDQLWQCIKFHIVIAASNGTTRYFVQIFLHYVHGYLMRAGHPNHPFVHIHFHLPEKDIWSTVTLHKQFRHANVLTYFTYVEAFVVNAYGCILYPLQPTMFVHASLFHNCINVQIFCYDTHLSNFFHCWTPKYLSFINLCLFQMHKYL